MDRIILHADANAFYASVECLFNPDIRDKPVAVSGDPAARHGIILTKNQRAKQAGVKTGEAIWQARQKCPNLVCVPPDYSLYIRFSQKLRRIYEQYSDRVESFGLDECWIDVSNPGIDIQEGERIANEIRSRVRDELGITVSVGVSWNKIYAKLGSDMRKPDYTTVISKHDYQETVWALPASDLLYVGPSTRKKLAELNVLTIGDLAHFDTQLLKWKLGKNGILLKAYACGADISPVMPSKYSIAVKSIGNSTTPPHDLNTMDDVRCIFFLLADSVAARLREGGFKARCISISARTTELVTNSRQRVIEHPTNLTAEIAEMALLLFDERFARGFPYRSVGISCSMLSADRLPVQLDLLGNNEKRERAEQLELTIDGLRKRYGHKVIQRGVVLTDRAFATISPKDDHTIHPVPFWAG